MKIDLSALKRGSIIEVDSRKDIEKYAEVS